jgi:hypothetical protein
MPNASTQQATVDTVPWGLLGLDQGRQRRILFQYP